MGTKPAPRTNLLPCPFCKGRRIKLTAHDEIADSWCMSSAWSVCCHRCGTIGPSSTDPVESAKKWNAGRDAASAEAK